MKFLASRSAAAAKGSPPREFLSASLHLTPAMIRTLGSQPIELIPAPGVGAIIIPIACLASGAGGVGFDTTDANPTICYDGDPLIGPTFPQLVAMTGYDRPFENLYGPGEARDIKSNAALVLTTDTGEEMTGGNYAIDLRVEYEIVRL